MEEEQFKRLCQACDDLLLEKDVPIERVALPWLHVIRDHPVLLKQYDDIFQKENVSGHIASFSLRSVLRRISHLVKLIFREAKWWGTSSKVVHKTEILFVSHLVKESHAGAEQDFYLGDLANKLHHEGVQSAFALLNHTETPASSLAVRWRDALTPRYILSDNLGFWQEARFYFRCMLESARLKNKIRHTDSQITQRVALRAAFELREGQAISNLRVGRQIRRLVRKLRPKLVIITYEGHAWERVVFAETRNAVPTIHCAGYQHAAIFRLHHSIRRSLSARFNPDSILTSGLVSHEQFQKSAMKQISTAVLGSNRGFSSRKKVENNFEVCLVLPEGFMSECILLFTFSLQCANECPNMKFIWRLHPLISFENIQEEMKLDSLPPNIILSKATIEDDINESHWALYRGTTSIIQAIKADLIPIYYHVSSVLIDPIYEINSERLYVKCVNDFHKLVQNKGDDLKREGVLEPIRAYADKFYAPFDHRVLLQRLRNNN